MKIKHKDRVKFEKMLEKQDSYQILFRQFLNAYANIGRKIAIEERTIWNKMLEKYGLDKNKLWRFNRTTGEIMEKNND